MSLIIIALSHAMAWICADIILPFINRLSNTDYETDYLEICSVKMFISEKKTYYCKSRTHFAAYAYRYGKCR